MSFMEFKVELLNSLIVQEIPISSHQSRSVLWEYKLNLSAGFDLEGKRLWRRLELLTGWYLEERVAPSIVSVLWQDVLSLQFAN